jgi:dipeptide/tripeptide permease
MNMAVIPGVLDIMPDQMQVVNPALILILLPLFNYVIYPLFTKLVTACTLSFFSKPAASTS